MTRRWTPTPATLLIALTLLFALIAPSEAIFLLSSPTNMSSVKHLQTSVPQQHPMVKFVGHALLSVTPTKESELRSLMDLLTEDKVDMWKEPSHVNESVQFRVTPEQSTSVESFLKSAGIKYERLIPNIQDVIDVQSARSRSTQFGWDNFFRIDEINAWMASLVAQHSDVAALVEGGLSYEGRRILGIKIAHSVGLPVIYLEGGIHAREWLSPAAATYIMYQLLASSDPGVQRAAHGFEWHIFPSVNPDGYEYSHTTDRLWRKTRSRTTINCFGADPNRNWEAAWGVTGISWKPCSEIFPGVKAMSELETVTRARYMEPLMSRMLAFVALHSYGQFVLFPWGFTHSHVANHNEMLEVGRLAAQAIFARSERPFRVGNLADTLYEASGSSMDWAHANGARFAYTIESRDTGAFGFLMPADQISPAVQELADAVMTIANEVLKRASTSVIT